MPNKIGKVDWTVSPDDLGSFDASVVRCIAGEFDETFLERVTKTAGVDIRQRMASLVLKHCRMEVEALRAMERAERQQLANDIVVAEADERNTMPGSLVQLRTIAGR